MRVDIHLTGHTRADLEAAIDEARRLVAEGFDSGGGDNDTSSFAFDLYGEPVRTYALADGDVPEALTSEPTFSTIDEAREAMSDGQILVAELGCKGGPVEAVDELDRE